MDTETVATSEFYCTHHSCSFRGRLRTRPWREDGGYPFCELCGRVMREDVQAPAVVWTGPIGQRYRDRNAENYHKPDGQWAWERNGPDGRPLDKPRPVRLETWRDVHEYAKREHCYDPREIPKTVEVGADGKSWSHTQRGISGQEV